MEKPKVFSKRLDTDSGEKRVVIRCPGCRRIGTIDMEQYRGEVSIMCPHEKCEYHETHDLTDQTPDF